MNQKITIEWVSCEDELPKMIHYREDYNNKGMYDHVSDYCYVTVELNNGVRFVETDCVSNGKWNVFNNEHSGKVVAWLRELKPYTL